MNARETQNCPHVHTRLTVRESDGGLRLAVRQRDGATAHATIERGKGLSDAFYTTRQGQKIGAPSLNELIARLSLPMPTSPRMRHSRDSSSSPVGGAGAGGGGGGMRRSGEWTPNASAVSQAPRSPRHDQGGAAAQFNPQFAASSNGRSNSGAGAFRRRSAESATTYTPMSDSGDGYVDLNNVQSSDGRQLNVPGYRNLPVRAVPGVGTIRSSTPADNEGFYQEMPVQSLVSGGEDLCKRRFHSFGLFVHLTC